MRTAPILALVAYASLSASSISNLPRALFFFDSPIPLKGTPTFPVPTLTSLSSLSKVSAGSDQGWETPFYAQGPAGSVYSVGSLNGKIIAAGDFRGADDVQTPCIAEWSGSRWSSLGGGLDQSYAGGRSVSGFVIDGKRLYVAKPPSIAGAACHGMAYWDGSTWTCMPGNFESEISSFGAWNGHVLASTASGTFSWDGKAWQSFPAVQGTITRFRTGPGGLWMCGRFVVAGDSSVRNLAVWDGGVWKGFGDATDALQDFAVTRDGIFAIESRAKSRYEDSLVLVHWDGKSWSRADAGLGNVAAMGLAADSENVFLVTADKGDFAGRLWVWRDSRFVRLDGSSFSGVPLDLEAVDGRLILGGLFRSGEAGGDNILAWENSRWRALTNVRNPGPFYLPDILRAHGSDLYVAGGRVLSAGNEAAHGIARWDGTGWDAMGGGFKGTDGAVQALAVRDVAFHGTDVFVGGHFDSSSSGAVHNVARWDGKAWNPLGDGFPGEVRSLLYEDSGLVAGGSADSLATRTPALKNQIIGRWNGSDWKAMGAGLQGRVDKLVHYRGKVCALGALKSPSDAAFSGLSEWDGAKWESVRDPANELGKMDSVIDAAVFHDTLFFLGCSRKIADFYLYAWNGTVASRQRAFIHATALAADDSALYVSGVTENAQGGQDFGTLYQYGPHGWKSLLTSRDFDFLTGMAVAGDYLYASGKPEGINGKPAYLLTRWNRIGTASLIPGRRIDKSLRKGLVHVSGNRASGEGFFGISGGKVFTLNGRNAQMMNRRSRSPK